MSHRESLDFNKELIDGRLGVRLAALYEDRQYRQRPAYELDRRLYGSLHAVLRKAPENAFLGNTTLRGSYELGELDGNPPNQIPPNDGLTHWWVLPTTDFESYTGQPGSGFLTSGAFVPQRTIDRRLPDAQSGWRAGPYISAWFMQMAVFYPNYGAGAESVNGLQGGMGTLRYSQLPAAAREALGVNGNTTYAASRNLFGLPIYPNFTAASADRDVFDYYNHLLGGENGYRDRDFDVADLALEQSFWNYRAGIELAYNRQDYDQDSWLPFGGGQSGGTGQSDIAPTSKPSTKWWIWTTMTTRTPSFACQTANGIPLRPSSATSRSARPRKRIPSLGASSVFIPRSGWANFPSGPTCACS
ncbi:MAG: hypothetical protein ACREIA_12165 [Opitutaceae bacterium]